MSDSSSEIQIHVKGKNSSSISSVRTIGRKQTNVISLGGYPPLGANELKLQITIKTDKTVQDLKHAIAEKTDAPADRQRLIYSGKVLKARLFRPISPRPFPQRTLTDLQTPSFRA